MRVSRVNAPIREQTLYELRSAIIRRQFKPGERLYEQKLCDLIGVSRTTIREVLRHLESEGLIQVVPQKGPIVAMLTLEEVENIYQVREVLEGLACRLFAKRATPGAMSALRRRLDLMEKYAAEKNVEKQVAESDAFYKVVLEGCGNKVVYSLIKLLFARITFLRTMTLSQEGRSLQSIEQLRAMYEAFEKSDSDAAWDASTFHIRDAKSVVLRVLQSQVDENGTLPM